MTAWRIRRGLGWRRWRQPARWMRRHRRRSGTHKRRGRGACSWPRSNRRRRTGWRSRRGLGWRRWRQPARWRRRNLRSSGTHKRRDREACSWPRSNRLRRTGWRSRQGWVSGFRQWRLKHPTELRMRPSLRAAWRRLRLPESALQGRCWPFARPLKLHQSWRMA